MPATDIARTQSIIAALTESDRAFLRARAENPFSKADTGAFKTTGKPGAKHLYTAYRPDRNTKVSLGAPADVLKCLDAARDEKVTHVEIPEVPVIPPPAHKISLPPAPPKTPVVQPLPSEGKAVSPTPKGQDTSWRIPTTFAAIAAVAAIGFAFTGICDDGAARRGNAIGPGASAVDTTPASLPHVVTTCEPAGDASLPPNLPVAPNGLGRSNAPSAIAAHMNVGSVAGDELAAVFAALHAANGQDSTQAVSILESQPATHPVLPRLKEKLMWPDSALVRGVNGNLRSAGYSHGVLTLWVEAPSVFAAAMKTGDPVMGSLAGWTDRGWEYSVQADRIEIREARR